VVVAASASRARYPIARQSRLVNVSAISHSFSARSSCSGSKKLRCDCVKQQLVPMCAHAKVETISFGFRCDFGTSAVILDSSATSLCALSIVERRQSEMLRAFLRCSASLGGVTQEFGYERMLV
jgi:hypothetical protein